MAAESEAAGFTVQSGPLTATVGEHTVLADHFPYRGEALPRVPPRGPRAVAPARPRTSAVAPVGRMVNVDVDAWGGYPVAETDLAELFPGGPAERVPLFWERWALMGRQDRSAESIDGRRLTCHTDPPGLTSAGCHLAS